jgi:hypothetical protein
MNDQTRTEEILRRRVHGLYLSRPCADIVTLSRELLGLHCWFHRNVVFSALLRGAGLRGWKTDLTKTWLYRGALHGVAYEDLPTLLALHQGDSYLLRFFGAEALEKFAEEVLNYMEDGIFSRVEFRKIFARDYDDRTIDALFSPWGGIFVYLARLGKVAFRDMTSRDFDLISAEPTCGADQVLPGLLRRYFRAYGPATLADAAWFFGFWKEEARKLRALPLDDVSRFEHQGAVYYFDGAEGGEIPELLLLSGFDPLIVSYTERGAVLPAEYKSRVILKSGICLPTIAVRGRVAGLWNLKKNAPVIEFFSDQPKRIVEEAYERVRSLEGRRAENALGHGQARKATLRRTHRPKE